MVRFRWLMKLSSAEKHLPWPLFVIFAIVAISICFTVWYYGHEVSTDIYESMSSAIEQQAEQFQK